MDMTLTVNGVDMTPYIAREGFQWRRNDIDGPNTGRNLAGYLRRNRVATKIRLDITCRLLKSAEAQTVLSAIMPEHVSVKYYDPCDGKVVTKTMYSNNNPASFQLRKPDGTVWWGGITFPLIEL